MSKALSRNTHWLPKTGSYAVRINRSGDIGEARPGHARDPVYEATERRRQGLVNALKQAEKERAEALASYQSARSLPAPEKREKLIDAQNRCTETRRRVADLQNEFRLVNAMMTVDGRSPTKHAFEKGFVDAAYVLLDSETFMRICNEAERLLRNAS